MRTIRLFPYLLVSAAFLAISPTSHAAEFYLGGGVYTSSVDESVDAVEDLDLMLDDDDTVPALFFGFKFLKAFAVEAGYYDLGSFSSQFAGGTAEADLNALALAGVGKISLVKLVDIYGKVGAAYVDSEITFDDQTIDAFRNSATDPYYGFGANVNLGGNLDIFGEYIVFDADLKTELFGLGLRLDF